MLPDRALAVWVAKVTLYTRAGEREHSSAQQVPNRRARLDPPSVHGTRRRGNIRYVRVALAQINTTVGDVWGNVEKATDALKKATDAGAELVALPELTITGYPPEDLLMRPKIGRAHV